MKTNAGPKKMTRHSDWDLPWQRVLSDWLCPPGLGDAFSEARWTVVTRNGNCEIASNAPGDMGAVTSVVRFTDHCGTMTTTQSWEQVDDDQTRKGMVKISVVVDSGAEANALPENMMQWIPLKPSSASKSGKIFRGAAGDPIPAREVGDRPNGRGTEPQDCLGSLPSEAFSTERCQNHRGWKSSLLGRGQGLRQEQQHGADHKPPSRAQRVDARPVGKETS